MKRKKYKVFMIFDIICFISEVVIAFVSLYLFVKEQEDLYFYFIPIGSFFAFIYWNEIKVDKENIWKEEEDKDDKDCLR